MSEVFIEDEGVAFVVDKSARKVFRLEPDKRVDISGTDTASSISWYGTPISRERAMELAEAFDEE
jgi:hypothetical protein